VLIEDSPKYKVAFGFDKGDAGSVNSGGQKIVDHCRSLARVLFVEMPELLWAHDDVSKLVTVVKNRINMSALPLCGFLFELIMFSG
jgi:hypothetical protein